MRPERLQNRGARSVKRDVLCWLVSPLLSSQPEEFVLGDSPRRYHNEDILLSWPYSSHNHPFDPATIPRTLLLLAACTDTCAAASVGELRRSVHSCEGDHDMGEKLKVRRDTRDCPETVTAP